MSDSLVEVIQAHSYRPSIARGVERCGCGESCVGVPGWHAAHLAAAIREAGFRDLTDVATRIVTGHRAAFPRE